MFRGISLQANQLFSYNDIWYRFHNGKIQEFGTETVEDDEVFIYNNSRYKLKSFSPNYVAGYDLSFTQSGLNFGFKKTRNIDLTDVSIEDFIKYLEATK